MAETVMIETSVVNTLKGQLPHGIVFGGVPHTAFEIRLPMIRDNVTVLSQHANLKPLEVSLGVMAEAIVSLGEIPKKELTLDFLLQNLTEADFDVLNEAFEALKKKRQAWAHSLNTTMPPVSS